MSKALDTVAAADFSMVRDDDNQVITIKSATLDAKDKTQVKLVVYTSLTDAKTYTVTYTAADEAKTQSSAKVTVTDGTVAAVNIDPLEITANQETTIYYQTLDANGVIVSEKPVGKTEDKVEVSCNTLLGTLDNTKSTLILYNVGDTATFTVTYHTYVYDNNGAETNAIKKDFTISAVKDATVVSQYKYTVATEKPYDWSKVTPVSTVALGDGDDGFDDRYAFFQIKDQKGKDITDSCDYTVESSDNSKIVADGTVKSEDGVLLKPVSTGSAYLMIKDTDGKVVSTLPITVGEKRKISVFKLDRNSVSIVTDAAANSVAAAYTEVTAKDQYGEDIPVTLTEKERTTYGKVTLELNRSDKSIAITSSGADNNKTSTFTITATDGRNNTMITTLNVTTKAPNKDTTYSVVFLNSDKKVISSVDTTVKETKDDDTVTGQAIKSVIVEKNNGVVVQPLTAGSVSCASIKVVRNSDNKTLYYAKAATTAGITTSSAISNDTQDAYGTGDNEDPDKLIIDVTSGTAPSALTTPIVKNLTTGTYTVVYEINISSKVYKPYATLTVSDKQTSVSASILNTNAGDKTFKNIMEDTEYEYVKFFYGDVQLKTSEYKYIKADYKINNNGKNAYVKSVTLNVKAADSKNYFQVTVPVNKTFTCNGTWTDADFS